MNGVDHLRPGIYDDVTAEDYHHARGLTRAPALSNHIVKLLIGQSPKHAKTAHPDLNPDYRHVEEDKFDLGSAAHVLLLEGDAFEARVHPVDAPDWRTKLAKEAKADARMEGLIPLLRKDWDRTQAMVDAIREQLPRLDVDPPFFADGAPERTVIWEEDGILCKARPDWLRSDLRTIDDFKSTSASAHPDVWSRRTFWSIGCDIQACWYSRGVQAVTGRWPEFRFLVAECYPPYAIQPFDLAPSTIQLAQRKIEFAIRKWQDCLRADHWPSYPTRLASVEMDGWQDAEFLRLTYGEEAAAA
jgi:hypothetical protein